MADPCHQIRSIQLSLSPDSRRRHRTILESTALLAQASAVWQDEHDTQAFAERLARNPALADARIELDGELGAGKTTFVRHLLRALGVKGRITSPSYAVVEPYQVAWPPQFEQKTADSQRSLDSAARSPKRLSIWHFDFYRFADPREWEDAGFRELFASPGLKLVEWPEQAAGLLPAPDLLLELGLLEDGLARFMQASAFSATGKKLIE